MGRKNLKMDKNSKILVALSGGVDSSVAAALLKNIGYEIEGAYMRCWSEGPYCSADIDQSDAAKVASKLEIPFHVFDFEEDYRKNVIDSFYAQYQAGKTPNPDVVCNQKIKFGLLLNTARRMGFDFIATGHYARVTNGVGYDLLAGVDSDKDQSYFLYLLGQKQLSQAIFPLGELTKKEVRKLAQKYNLPTATKPDSTGICFIGPTNIRSFLLHEIKPQHGDIVSIDGKALGRHIGLPFYTIGQREGVGISAQVPYYVASKNVANNTLIVAPFGHSALFKRKFTTNTPHWVNEEPTFPLYAQVRLRHRAPLVDAEIVNNKNSLVFNLSNEARAITPGQSAVIYSGEKVLGGAIVDRVID